MMRRTISIMQLCLPHYRRAFFAHLARTLGGRLVVVAGEASFGGSPTSVLDTPEIPRRGVRNLFIANRLALQYPLPAAVYRDEIVVLEFNPRIISNILILLGRKLLGKPVILWGHGLSPRTSSPHWLIGLRKSMAHLADAVIFYGEKGRQDFLAMGIEPAKLFVAHNAIDVETIRGLTVDATPDRKDVIYVGRLSASKRVDLLLHGFARALARLPEATNLLVVGDGPERDHLIALAQELGVARRVRFPGEVTESRHLASHFRGSLLAVSPGYTGLFAILSLAHGVPVLSADAEPHGPEIEALEPGRNCELFAANDPDALARKLVDMLANPARLIEMGNEGARQVAKKYSVQQMTSVFLRAFDFVLRP